MFRRTEITDYQVEQTLELTNNWNWWSTNLDITLAELEAALGTNGVKIAAQNGDYALYKPSSNSWRGDIADFGVGNMYKIQTSSACTITVTGVPVNPADVSITIVPGANWIGYPLDHEIDNISQAFSSDFTPTLGDLIKDANGNYASYTRTGWRGIGLTLRPGQGYIYQSKANENKILIFSSGQDK